MKKRILAIVLAMTMIMSVAAVKVYATEDASQKVEIKFCVGDESLTINGVETTVEKPYVVGEGVTLVPVRVITEAFGAKVDWVDETQTVLLDYPGVQISLQIGNPVAEVNGKAETLLAAPELPKDVTMVPLRFISETFGAVVTYNPETEEITVTKDVSENGETIVEGAIDSKYVGDSFYGWSMENPVDAVLSYSAFDGSSVTFDYEDGSSIYIDVYKIDKDYDFDKDFAQKKARFEGYTLSRAEKISSDENKKSMHFQARDKKYTDVVKVFVTPQYRFCVNGYFLNESEDIKNSGVAVLETFDVTFERENIYDLSTAKDGFRKFESEFLKYSFKVPQNFVMVSSESAQNDFMFQSEDEKDMSFIASSVFSKDNGFDAKTLAEKDYNLNKKISNDEFVKFLSDVSEKTYGDITGFEYVYDITAEGYNIINRDFFFEKGEYVYNLHVAISNTKENKNEIADEIFNSIEVEELDYNVVGSILDIREEKEGTTTYDDLLKCEFKLANSFDGYVYDNMANFVDQETQVAVTVACDLSEEYTFSKVKDNIKQTENMSKKYEECVVVESTTDKTFGKKKYASLLLKITDEGSTGYVQQYATEHNGVAYVISIIYDEIMYSDYSRNLINDMMNSFVFK